MPLRAMAPWLYCSYLMFVILSSIAAFSPLILGYPSNMENSPLSASLQSRKFRESSIAILALNFAFCYVVLLERTGALMVPFSLLVASRASL